jgi:hypothetical protein
MSPPRHPAQISVRFRRTKIQARSLLIKCIGFVLILLPFSSARAQKCIANCPLGWRCVNNQCVPVYGHHCSVNDFCPPGPLFHCTSDAVCPSGSCVDGKCQPRELCLSDSECGLGTCSSGRCAPRPKFLLGSCEKDSQCPSGSCVLGKCKHLSLPKENGSSCSAGSQCLSGSCRIGICVP